jgi:hypothetical protein
VHRHLSSALSFVRRDFQIAMSYRVPFLLDFAGAFFVIFEFYFLAKLVPESASMGDYLGFVATGLVVTTFLVSGASIVANNIRQEQVQGTIEVTLSSGLTTPALALGISAYPVMAGAVRAAIYAVLAAGLGARVTGANWALAGATLTVGAISFVAIGLMAVGLVLVFRQAAVDPADDQAGARGRVVGRGVAGARAARQHGGNLCDAGAAGAVDVPQARPSSGKPVPVLTRRSDARGGLNVRDG